MAAVSHPVFENTLANLFSSTVSRAQVKQVKKVKWAPAWGLIPGLTGVTSAATWSHGTASAGWAEQGPGSAAARVAPQTSSHGRQG